MIRGIEKADKSWLFLSQTALQHLTVYIFSCLLCLMSKRKEERKRALVSDLPAR